nr:retrovirus-related Pol polyprotein from transposon TNT 1-94 [Tanacetum cinerariifolium]
MDCYRLATLYGKYNYEEDVKEDQRTINEFLVDLNAEYHERALLANQKRFYKRFGRVGSARKPLEKPEKHVLLMMKGAPRSGHLWQMQRLSPQLERLMQDQANGLTLPWKKSKEKLVSKFNVLKQEISIHKSELSNLKNTVSINCSLQNKVIKVNLENESVKDEIIDLKKVIEKWICSKVTLDQLLSEQVPGNIVKALGEEGKRKEKISSKEVFFTKADESSFVLTPEITSYSESECDSQKPRPPLPKLIGAAPSGTSERTRPSIKVSPAYVINKKTEKSPADPNSCSDKKDDLSTKQLLLTLMEEPKCSTYGSTDHLTKEHLEHIAVKKTLSKLKAQSPRKPSPKKASMIQKPFIELLHMKHLTVLRNTPTPGDQGLPTGNQNPLKSGLQKELICVKMSVQDYLKRKMENLNEVRVKELKINNGTEFRNLKLKEFCDEKGKFDEKANDGFFLGYSPVAKAFRVINIRRQEMKEIVHVTFSEDDEAISQSSTKGDAINFNENRSFLDDEFLEPRSELLNALATLNEVILQSPVPQDRCQEKSTLNLKIENLNEVRVKELRINNGTEFRNLKLEEFCDEKGISQNFSSPCTPDQNGVAERKNRTLIEAARTMLNSAKLPKQFWGETANIACYTQNRSIIVKRHEKTSYDVFRGRSLNISYFYVFGCHVHIHSHMDHLGKFNEKADDGFFLGYSPVAKAFRVINIRREEMKETVHVTFSEDYEAISQSSTKGDAINFNENRSFLDDEFLEPRSELLNALATLTLEEEGWIIAMQEELNQFERNKIWTLVPKPHGKTIIGTKWIWKNKMDENGKLLRTRKDWYQANPKESYLVAVKRFFRYLKGTPSLGLLYLKESIFDLKAHSDSDYIGCNLDRKSTSGSCQILEGKLVCWNAKKQSSTAMSSVEADFDQPQPPQSPVIHQPPHELSIQEMEDLKQQYLDELKRLITPVLSTEEPDKSISMGDEHLDTIPATESDEVINNDLTLVKPYTITAASFQKPLAYEVPLTLHMLKAAKLSEEPEQSLLPPYREVNADDTTDKSLSRASVQPVIQSKATTDLKTKKKKIPPSSIPKSPYKVRVILPKKQVAQTQHAEVRVATTNATKSLKAFELAEEQGNQPLTAEAVKVLDQHVKEEKDDEFVAIEKVDKEISLEILTVEQLLDESDKLNKAVQEPLESPYDTKSEIKGSDSDLQSMPDDDLRSVSGFHTTDFDNTHKNKVSLHSRLGDMESSIVQQVSTEFKSSLPALVIDSLKEQLPSLLSDALKVTLPRLLKDSIRSSISKSIEEELPHVEAQVQKNLQD